jgi:hypothetical protein
MKTRNGAAGFKTTHLPTFALDNARSGRPLGLAAPFVSTMATNSPTGPLGLRPFRGRLLEAAGVVAVAAATLGIAGTANAQTYTWAGTGSTPDDYKLATNWSNQGAAPPPPVNAGQDAVFSSTGNLAVFTGGLPIAPGSWTFDATSQAFTVSGADVNFNGAGLVNSASAGTVINIYNNMTGTALSQAGAGALTILGTNAFTTTDVTAGVLNNLGSLTSTVTNNGFFTNGLSLSVTLTGDVTNTHVFSNYGTVTGSLNQSAGGPLSMVDQLTAASRLAAAVCSR